MKKTILLIVFLTTWISLAAQSGMASLDGLAELRNYESKRISSFDTTGRNADRFQIPAGETKTIAEIKGAGIIKHIWITISCSDHDPA